MPAQPDRAYPPFILASTAATLGWNVSVFFTFYGLNLLKMPFGPAWSRSTAARRRSCRWQGTRT